MTTTPLPLEACLELDDRDAGCGHTWEALECYVEAELRGEGAAGWLSGIAAHLGRCAACRADHDGLLAITEREGSP